MYKNEHCTQEKLSEWDFIICGVQAQPSVFYTGGSETSTSMMRKTKEKEWKEAKTKKNLDHLKLMKRNSLGPGCPGVLLNKLLKKLASMPSVVLPGGARVSW